MEVHVSSYFPPAVCTEVWSGTVIETVIIKTQYAQNERTAAATLLLGILAFQNRQNPFWSLKRSFFVGMAKSKPNEIDLTKIWWKATDINALRGKKLFIGENPTKAFSFGKSFKFRDEYEKNNSHAQKKDEI